jgi:hypothetical protein
MFGVPTAPLVKKNPEPAGVGWTKQTRCQPKPLNAELTSSLGERAPSSRPECSSLLQLTDGTSAIRSRRQPMVNRKLVLAVCGMALSVASFTVGVGAIANPHRTTYLTFSQPVQLPGVSLGSGTYIFEIANPSTSADVVRVLSRDRSKSYFMGFTRPVNRPRSLPRNHLVSLAESARDTAPPVTVWWPENESTGRQFIYLDGR